VRDFAGLAGEPLCPRPSETGQEHLRQGRSKEEKALCGWNQEAGEA
jgi:hypothetical protein